MSWHRWAIATVLVGGVLAGPGTPPGSAAPQRAAAHRTYEVSYTATGHYAADTLVPIACGNETENENTAFSWTAQYRLGLSFGRHGFSSASDTDQPRSTAGDDNSSTVKFSGCAGDASCHGESEPSPNSKASFSASAASAGGRSKFLVNGLGSDGIRPTDFSGSWSAEDPGSCEKWAQSAHLVTEEFGINNEVEAKFPVKYSTLKSLPVGHYFKVHITAGHYAAPKADFCHPDDGCESETFTWSGIVRVKRTS